ncbi:MAG: NAD+ synthase [Acidimicrobiales bacterium]
MASLRVAACQLNTVVGDLDGNVTRIIAALREAEAAGCDLAVFPELAVSGYPPEDLILKSAFVDDVQAALQRVAVQTGECVAIVGFVDGEEAVPTPTSRASNAAPVCPHGEVKGVYHKRALPDYGVFDEERYFSPGSHALDLYQINGVTVGISICEDLWIPGGPIAELARGGAQLVLNINASPMEQGRMAVREAQIRGRIEESGVPIVYVNQVGGQDELVFDGGSMVYDADANLVARADQFTEAVMVVDVEPRAPVSGDAYPVEALTHPRAERQAVRAHIAPLREPLDEVWNALVLGTRDYVRKSGFSNICLGLSGGVDSSIVAVIATDALGAENVHTVAMPSRFSSDGSLSDAAKLAANLGCDHRVIPIEPAHAALLDMLSASFDGADPDVTEENIQSRIRGVVLMALANKFGWLVLTTGNKSETAVGYSTLYGDTAGAFAVIKDVWKLEVYDLCRWRNSSAGTGIIPETVLTKAPSAELRPDQRDDQSLPPYEILDPLLQALVENDQTAAQLIDAGHDESIVQRVARIVDLAEYKRRQSPVGPKISPKAFGRDRRMPITNHYRGLPVR